METVTEQPIKKIEFFRCPQCLLGVAPLTKKPEDSGYEIGALSVVPHFSLSPPRCLFSRGGDFHARSRFARPTIPEEKWGTTRSLGFFNSALV